MLLNLLRCLFKIDYSCRKILNRALFFLFNFSSIVVLPQKLEVFPWWSSGVRGMDEGWKHEWIMDYSSGGLSYFSLSKDGGRTVTQNEKEEGTVLSHKQNKKK